MIRILAESEEVNFEITSHHNLVSRTQIGKTTNTPDTISNITKAMTDFPNKKQKK